MLAHVDAVQSNKNRQSKNECTRLSPCEYLLTFERVCDGNGERGQLGRVSARKRALALGAAAARTWWTLAMNEHTHRAHGQPAGKSGAGDGRAAAMAAPAQRSRRNERNGDVRAREPEDFQRTLSELEAPVVQPARARIDGAIERRRLVDQRDEREGTKRGN